MFMQVERGGQSRIEAGTNPNSARSEVLTDNREVP